MSLLFIFIVANVVVAASGMELAISTPQDELASKTIEPTSNSNGDLMGDSLIRRNRASHPRQQLNFDPNALAALQGAIDDGGVPVTRPERNLLKGLPLPTAALITEILISLNNLLAKFDVTVVLLPAPFPVRLARCIPGCLQNPECRGAVTTGYGGAEEAGGSPLTAVLGLLKLGL